MTFSRQYQGDLLGDASGHEGRLGVIIVVAAGRSTFKWAILVGSVFIAIATLWDPTALLAMPGVFMGAFFFALGDSSTWELIHLERQRRPLSLPDPGRFCDPAVKDILRRLASSRCHLCKAIAMGPNGHGCLFASASRNIRAIEAKLIVLVARVEYLGQLLSMTPASDVERDLERLRCLEARALVPATRAAYQRAMAVCEGRLPVVRELGFQREWLLAGADHLLCILESLPGRVARIQFSRLVLGDGELSGTDDDVDELRAFLEAAEETFASNDPCGLIDCTRERVAQGQL